MVGGGPVGLLLACLLAGGGVDVAVFERRRRRRRHSRSIGVHPPALEVLARAGLAEAFMAGGVRVLRGHAYAGRRRLGTLSFGSCPPPYRFVLTLPQTETERLLEARLALLTGLGVSRGAEVVALEASSRAVRLRLRDGAEVEAALAVACDGAASAIRTRLGIPVQHRTWPDRYVMGDFPDTSVLGTDAAVFLTGGGVVESFPLPGGWRRWVAAVPGRHGAPPAGPDAAARWLGRLVEERTGECLEVGRCAMVSAFGVRTVLALQWVAGRVVLAGDAAHALPPFGGQGMNLGWLDAAALASALHEVRGGADLERATPAGLQRALAGYQERRSAAARDAARRAAFNLRTGRAEPWLRLRQAAVWAGLRSPLAAAFARSFTMRGLDAGVRSAGCQGARLTGA